MIYLNPAHKARLKKNSLNFCQFEKINLFNGDGLRATITKETEYVPLICVYHL